MSFQINGADPPGDYAYPRTVEGGDLFTLAEPTGNDGEGKPVGAIGYPSYEVHFDYLPLAGWTWYAAFVGEAAYVELTSLQVWNPYKSSGAGGWETYSSHAIMHRPTHGGLAHGGLGYWDVRIRFTELY